MAWQVHLPPAMRPSPIEIELVLLGTVRGGEDPTTPPLPRPTFSPEAPIRRRVQGSWEINTILGSMSGEGEGATSRTRIGACLEQDTIENCVKFKEQSR
jgi:hypothetical protein